MIGVEPAGEGIESGRHGAPLTAGSEGIFFGMKSFVMQDRWGQIRESHSISAGLDFPSVGPQHAYLRATGRARYTAVTDDQALQAFSRLAHSEGILPALESAHAVAYALQLAESHPEETQLLLVNLSGRGDKDLQTVEEALRRSDIR